MYQYEMKVRREKTYLWGGALIENNFDFDFFLICRVDDFGESIDLSSEKKGDQGSQPVLFGTLRPGETYIVSLRGISGIFAQTQEGNVDSPLTCKIVCPSDVS